jgi:group II intron reverse transcriptase/maturase
MTTDELRPWLDENWPKLRMSLEDGTYRPQPVRQVTIPKPDGGQRILGVQTVVDRMISQALAQVLTPIFDPAFSEHSFGYRSGRSAHQAVRAAQGYVVDGYRWVVDVDLEKFFDRVQHDVLMARVARKVKDKRVLKLIRRFLNAGIMVDGVKQASAEGTPQGSPLSPLLSNIMLDDLDKELESRGHRFVRYADDARIFVSSERAATRVLAGVTDFVEKRLKLKVNVEKSKVTTTIKATLLGFGFYLQAGKVKIRVAPPAIKRFKERLRELTGRNWGVSMRYRINRLNRYTSSWMAYFRIADTPGVFRKLDQWLRRRLRQVCWKQWKRIRTRISKLQSLGINPGKARYWGSSTKGPWHIAGTQVLDIALPNAYWRDIGLVGIEPTWTRYKRT